MAEPVNKLSGYNPPELRQWDPPWYQRIPYAVTDYLYGPNANAQQAQPVINALGVNNPFNVLAQAQESGETLGRGVKFGEAATAGLGALGAGLAVMGLGGRGRALAPEGMGAARSAEAKLIDNIGRNDPHSGDVIGYHGTTAPAFETFDRSKMLDPLGPFFGTKAQANKFATPNYARPEQGEPRIIEGRISTKKSLDVDEDPSVLGTGVDTYIQPTDIVTALNKAGLDPLQDEAVRQAFERTNATKDFNDFRNRMKAERYGREETSMHTADRIKFDALKDFMSRNGFDSVRRWSGMNLGWEYAPVSRNSVTSPSTGKTLYASGLPIAIGAGAYASTPGEAQAEPINKLAGYR